MKNSERVFYFFDCEVKSYSQGVKLPTMDELVAVWKRRADTGEAKHSIRKQSAKLLVGGVDLDPTESVVTMLVRLSDTTASNVVYSDPAADSFIEHKKTGTQGNDVGCQVLISTRQEKEKPNVYCAMVEGVQGLSYREVQSILNQVIGNEYAEDKTCFAVDDPRGRRTEIGELKKINHRPRVEFNGHPSENFVADIERGKLGAVTLIKSEPQQPVGGMPYLHKVETHVKVLVDRQNLPQNLWDGISSALQSEAKIFPKAKISFRLPDQPRAVTVTVNTETGMPADELYIRSVRLANITPFLAYSSKVIVAHLMALAKPHLLAHRQT